MIVCSRCGFQNEDSDTFCGSCASFLEWEGQKVQAEAPAPEPEAEPEPQADAHVGIIERVKEAIGLGDDSPNGAATNGQVAAVAGEGTEEAEQEAEPEVLTPGAVAAPVAGGGLSGVAGQSGSINTPAPAAHATATAEPEGDISVTPEPTASVAAPPDDAAAAPAAAPGPVARSSAPPSAPPAPFGQPSAPSSSPAPPTSTPAPPSSTPAPPASAPAAPVTSAPAASTSAPAVAGPGVSAPGAPHRTSSPVGPAAPARPVAPAAAKAAPVQPGGPGPVAPAPVQPQAVQPTAVKGRPVAKKAPSVREINPGDKICGQCGEGNDPARKFCRRCGASLVEAAVFKLPWYRALWRRMTHRQQKQAGARPKMRRRAFGGAGGWLTNWVTRLVVLAIVVVVVLSFVGPYHKTLKRRETRYYHNVVNLVHPTYNQYFAHSATASSSAPGHPPILAVDGQKNTSWQTNAKTTGQYLVVSFPSTVNIAKVGFDIGDQDTPQAFQTEPRPAQVEFVFEGAQRLVKVIHLKDVAGFQTFTLTTKGSNSFTMFIQSVYPATGSGQNVSVSELEFFTKS